MKTTLMILLLLVMASLGYAQTTGTWALTANADCAVAGSFTGSAMAPGSGINTIAYSGTNGVNSRGWNSASLTSTDYYEYTVTATANLNISSVTFYTMRSGTAGTAQAFYSINGATEVQLGNSFSVPTTPAQRSYTGLSLAVTNGQTFRVRVYAWSLSSSTSLFYNRAMVITGTLPAAVTLASANPAVAAGSAAAGSVKYPIYRFTLAGANANTTLNQVNFTTEGTYVAADMTNFKLWTNTSDAIGTTQIGTTMTTGLGTGAHSFTGLTQAITSGATRYFWVSADVAGAAVAGHTINVAAMTTADLTFAAGTQSGTAYAGGAQTIPYLYVSEGFETTNPAYPPTGWTNNATTPSTTSVHSGTYSARFSATTNYLYTPLLAKPGTMTWWGMRTSGSGNTATITVYTCPEGSTTWTSRLAQSLTNTFTMYTVDLSQYPNVYVRFSLTALGGSYYAYLDDVTITSRAPTLQASSVNFSGVQTNQITANWTRGNGASCVVFLKEGVIGTPGNPADGTTYSAGTNWNSKGTQLGTTGYYCVYNGTGTTETITNLLAGTTYHAIVYEYVGSGATSVYMNVGSTAYTLTLPSVATLVGPTPDGVTELGYAGQTLSWSAGSGGAPTGYKVYFDTNTTPTTLVSTQGGTTYGTGALLKGQTYYWQIVPYNGTGDAASCPIWSFTTRAEQNPGAATDPVPDGTATIYTNSYPYNQTLSWTAPIGTPVPTGYKVYIGTDTPPTNIVDGVTQTGLSRQFSVTAAGIYNWKIVPYYTDPGTRGDATGCPTWSFTSALTAFTVDITSTPSVADIFVGGIDSGENTPHQFIMGYGTSATYTVQMAGYSFAPTELAVSNITANASQEFTGTLIPVPDVPADTPTDVGGGVTIETTVDLYDATPPPITDPIFDELPNLSGNTNIILSYTGAGTGTLTFTVGVGTWYAWVFHGLTQYAPTTPDPQPLVVMTGTDEFIFANINFDAKGDAVVLLSEGADPTLPVELSAFLATATPQNYVMLQWTTQSETNVSGYYIFRNTANSLSTAQRVNNFIIEATNTSGEANYTYTDMEATPGNTYYYWLQNIDMSGEFVFHGPISVTLYNNTNPIVPVIPVVTELKSIYPNPFNPIAIIPFELAKAENVTIEVYNIRGEKVRSLMTESKSAGTWRTSWNGKDENGIACTTGMYYVKMTAGKFSDMRKIVLMK